MGRLQTKGIRAELGILLRQIGRWWIAFARGHLILMLVVAVITWLGLAALGVPGARYQGTSCWPFA